MKNFRFKHTKFSKNEGFVTLEIIVAILVAMGFLAVAMQSLVYAMAIKIQAQEKQRASQLISEDLELANELANRSDLPGNCNPANYSDGYGRGLFSFLRDPDRDGNNDDNPTKDLLSNGGGRQVALEREEVSNNANSNPPHRTLRIKYQVWHWDEDNSQYLDKAGNVKDAADEPIAETYVEIIPDVALACP